MPLLIDADVLAMQAVTASQVEMEFEPDVWHLSCDIKDAWCKFNEAVDELMAETSQKDYLLCFSDPERVNFRKQLNATYKATRSARKPVGFWPFESAVREAQKKRVRWKPRLEADDVMGILATRDVGKHVIWSIDKDLKQIPGMHILAAGEGEVDQEDADRFFHLQVLTGDSVDNYPGCPGIGPVRAMKVLDSNPDDPWSAIVNAYTCAGLTEADALLQARMAFILRSSHYNVETGKIRLWKPT